MTDAGLKRILGFVIRNREQINSLLERFSPEEIEHGILSIHQDIINRDFKMMIMNNYSTYLNDYMVTFSNGSIYLDLDLNLKQLGRVKAKYMLTIKNLLFYEGQHLITFSYQEDVKSEGNIMQNMAFKAASLKGSYLKTAVELSKLDFIDIDNNIVEMNLDKINEIKKIPPSLSLNYISCENGALRLRFNI